ncbi:alpha/beta fold hydrolase [Litoribacillus peritrichatus]|uniref:Alpha/beta fold hydrolase n=1 Tax=Litoribacillus peritrichatus TaxID=718191 RepID=A0ABP7NC44_9GAMM
MQLTVNGQTIKYLLRGEGEPILFLHGNPDTSHLWSGMIALLEKQYLCIAPDLPGYGESEIAPDFDFSLSGQANFIDDFVKALKLDSPVHLVVHDVGAFFGLSWAVACSEQVRSITIFNTAYTRDYRWHKLGRIWRTPLLGELSLALMDERTFVGSIRRVAPKLPKNVITQSYQQLTKKTHKTMLKLYRAMNPSVFIGWDERFQRVARQTPVQVVWGSQDPYIERRIARTFGTEKITYLEDYSHWVPAEAPEQAAECLVSFLNDLD